MTALAIVQEPGADKDLDEREAKLWTKLKATRSAAAREELFQLHLPFAGGVARRHALSGGGIDYQDLYQLACVGLLEAIDHYKPETGVPFRAYSRRRISGSILDGISRMSEVREQISFRNRLRRERTRSLVPVQSEGLSAEDSLHALADLAVGLALGFMLEGTGLYRNEGEEDHQTCPYGSLAWKQAMARLGKEVSGLPEREQKLLRYHYTDGLTFEQIGALFGLTKGRISQMHKAALALLQKRLGHSGHVRLQL